MTLLVQTFVSKIFSKPARMFPAGSSQGLVEGDYQFIYGWFGLRRHCHRSLVSLAHSMDFYRYSTWFFLDCGHRSFAKQRWVNDLVGHLFMLLIYPFHSWRILHNHHHAHQ